MTWASLFWKIGFGFTLFALSVFCGYLWATIGSISDILRSVKRVMRTLISSLMKSLVNQEARVLLQNINQRLERLSSDLPQLLEHLAGVRQQIRSGTQTTDDESPEITEPVSSNAAQVDN